MSGPEGRGFRYSRKEVKTKAAASALRPGWEQDAGWRMTWFSGTWQRAVENLGGGRSVSCCGT